MYAAIIKLVFKKIAKSFAENWKIGENRLNSNHNIDPFYRTGELTFVFKKIAKLWQKIGEIAEIVIITSTPFTEKVILILNGGFQENRHIFAKIGENRRT
jgi:hypothetical protein